MDLPTCFEDSNYSIASQEAQLCRADHQPFDSFDSPHRADRASVTPENSKPGSPMAPPSHTLPAPLTKKVSVAFRNISLTSSSTCAPLAQRSECSEHKERTERDELVRRAEIASVLEQATEVARVVGEIDPPPRRGRYQRRNSFVVHKKQAGGLLSSGTTFGSTAIPDHGRPVWEGPSIQQPKRRKICMESGASILGLSPNETNHFLRRMNNRMDCNIPGDAPQE